MPNQGRTQHNTIPDEPYDPLSVKTKQTGIEKQTTGPVGGFDDTITGVRGAVGAVDEGNERW